MINQKEFQKENYRQYKISVLGGIVLLASILASSSIIFLIPKFSDSYENSFALLFIVTGFAFVGLLDDLVGDKSKQGFKGHLSELIRGRVTTGTLKLFGAPLVALIALSSQIEARGYLWVLVDVVAISLVANLFNLLDLSPGRTSKYAIVTLLVIAFAADTNEMIFMFLGVIFASLIGDLREKYMLGDCGSNVIGAIVGYFLIDSLDNSGAIILILISLTLNLASEFVSFSKIIQKIWPLKMFDFFGQTKSRRDYLKNK